MPVRPCIFPSLVTVAAFAVGSSTAHGQIMGYSAVRVDNSAGGATLDGYVTNDIRLDFGGRLSGVELLTELDAGAIYQDPIGGDNAPNEGIISFFPSLAFDTFITLGGPTSATADAAPGVAGGAVGIPGGSNSATFGDSLIDISYFPPGGLVVMDQAGYLIARITLSEDAQGQITVDASTGSFDDLRQDVFPIVNGVIAHLDPGDFNGNGNVEQGDLDLVLQNWGQDHPSGTPPGWSKFQPHDGRASQNELDAVLQNWGVGAAPDFTGTAVPEPGVGVAGLIFLAAVRRRRHGRVTGSAALFIDVRTGSQ